MNSNTSENVCASGSDGADPAQMIYGKRMIDNGAKWGSYVTRNPDGTFPFDEQLKRENPDAWDQMIIERMDCLSPKKRTYIIPKKWSRGKTPLDVSPLDVKRK
jgi:hypothetical protein